MMPLFSFSLDAFQILDTRSAHNDTDYVSLCVKVNNNKPLLSVARIGDVNNGNHPVNLKLEGIAINQSDTVAVNYLIVNAGSTTLSSAESALGQAAALIVEGPTGPAGRLPQPGSALLQLYSFLNNQLQGVFKSGSCDGPVAAECGIFSYTSLASKVPFHENTIHPGVKPQSGGCNARVSNYTVNWSMSEVTMVPDFFEMGVKEAQTASQAAELIPAFSGPNQRLSWVAKQSPARGEIVAKGSTVKLTLSTGEMP